MLDSTAQGAVLVEAREVTKAFAGVVANDKVSIQLRAGEIHVLLGENGAGKSTLASILTGLYSADSGEVRIGDSPVVFQSPRDALARGIGIIHQHFHLVDRFSVAENIVLGDPRQGFFMDVEPIHAKVKTLGERYGLHVNPAAIVDQLSLGERQRVEIVKMLIRDVEVLFLDEPTAVLTPAEVKALFDTLVSMARDGKAIVLVTHKLDEVFSISDRATIMRGGKVVASGPTSEHTPESLARLMVGRDVDLARQPSNAQVGAPLLSINALSLKPDHNCGLHDINLDIRSGEIVGIAGVSGNGQLLLAETVAGLLKPDSGSVTVEGIDVTGKGPRALRAAGLAYVPEDRLGVGLSPSLTLAENLQLTKEMGFLFDRKAAHREGVKAIADFEIRARGPEQIVRRLSGGNVQKILLARELGGGKRVFVVASPARGLDVSGIAFVHNLLRRHRDEGAAILLLSEDLDEIRTLSDRIAVMFSGRITHECSYDDFDEAEIGLAMAGSKKERFVA